MLTQLSRTEFFRFACTGTVGFVADYLIVLLCVQGFMLSPYLARIFSFMAVVLTTYVMNKKFTFAARIKEGSRTPGVLPYTGAMLWGLCVNYGAYVAALSILPLGMSLELRLLLAVGIGSLSGMGVNFFVCRAVLFKQQKESR